MNPHPQTVPPPAVTVRAATSDDLDALAPLFDAYRQFYGQPADLGLAHRFLSERMVRAESHVLLAGAAGGAHEAALGFAQLYPMHSSMRCRRTLVLNDLFVAAAHRRQGVAWALLDAARRLAMRHGAASMTLQTAATNTQAQALYHRFGFVPDDGFRTYLLALS